MLKKKRYAMHPYETIYSCQPKNSGQLKFMYINQAWPKYIIKHGQQKHIIQWNIPPHPDSQNNSKAPKFLKGKVTSWFFT